MHLTIILKDKKLLFQKKIKIKDKKKPKVAKN